MKKVYITDKQGNEVLPKTHVSAVYDDEGNDLGSHLGAFEDEVRGLVDTPHQEYVTVATYASLPASGSEDTIYRVSNYDGSQSQVAADVYSEYAWDGTQYVFLCVKSAVGEVFDISAYHNNATYADLNAALTSNTGGVPQSLQKGGMSIKYVQSSDNKYVQFRLMSDTFNTAEDNWQNANYLQEKKIYQERILLNNGQNADLNNCVAAGMYRLNSGCTNVPTGVDSNNASVLFVTTGFANDRDYAIQQFYQNYIDSPFVYYQRVIQISNKTPHTDWVICKESTLDNKITNDWNLKEVLPEEIVYGKWVNNENVYISDSSFNVYIYDLKYASKIKLTAWTNVAYNIFVDDNGNVIGDAFTFTNNTWYEVDVPAGATKLKVSSGIPGSGDPTHVLPRIFMDKNELGAITPFTLRNNTKLYQERILDDMGNGANLNDCVAAGMYKLGDNCTNVPNGVTSGNQSVLFVTTGFANNREYAEQKYYNNLIDYPFTYYVRTINISTKVPYTEWTLCREETLVQQAPILNRNIKALITGDSITAGAGAGGSSVCYPGVLSKALNWIPTYNGHSGWFLGNPPAGVSDECLVDLLCNTDLTNYDIVTLMAGTNDWNRSQNELGTINDDATQNTLCGKLVKLINYINTNYPKVSLVIISPTDRYSNGVSTYETLNREGGWSLKMLNDIEKELCHKYNIPFVESINLPVFSTYNQSSLLQDGLHPTLIGHIKLGLALAAAMPVH